MPAHELNLIPQPILLRTLARRRIRLWARWGGLLIGVAIGLRFTLGYAAGQAERSLGVTASRAEAGRAAVAQLEARRAERDALAQAVLRRASFAPPGSVLDLFRALEEALPEAVCLRTLRCEPASDAPGNAPPGGAEGALPAAYAVTLEGVAPSADLVAAFLFRLATRPDMSHTNLEFTRSEDAIPGSGAAFAVRTCFHLGLASAHVASAPATEAAAASRPPEAWPASAAGEAP